MVGTITITSPVDGSTVSDAIVVFTYEVDDVTLGIGNIEVSIDGGEFRSVLEGDLNQDLNDSAFFPQEGMFSVEFEHGLHQVEFRVVDRLNNIQDPVTEFEINVDITTTVTIDVLPDYTNNPGLVVTGTRESGAAIEVTVNGSTNDIGTIAYPTAITWSTTAVLTEGANIIVATATDAQNNVASAQDTVILDTIAPAPPTVVQINPLAPNFLELNISEFDTNQPNQQFVGTKEANTSIRLNDIEIVPSDELTDWTANVVLVEGANSLSFDSVDLANNASAPILITINVDTTIPTAPEILINDDADFTLTRDVTLTLSAVDATEVKVSEDANFSNAEFVPYDDSGPLNLPFELSRGGGVKTVYAIFRDAVGNETVPVFDTIVLPDTISTVVERTPDMTIQAFENVMPDNVEYFIKLTDDRDGMFRIDVFNTALDAINQTNRVGYACSAIEGEQTLPLAPDGGGIDPGGTITVTLIAGAETVIYRYRTDVFDLSENENTDPIVYSLQLIDDKTYAQIEVPIFDGIAFGRVLETEVDGDPTMLRISKGFDLDGEDTAIVEQTRYPITDLDGSAFPIVGARLCYPLSSSDFEVLNLEEEDDAYLITVDKDFEEFNALFGYQIMFSRRSDLVTDYVICPDGTVEFWNESDLASGNVEITYNTPQVIQSNPSAEFHEIAGSAGDQVCITVEPVSNLILFSDLDRVCLRIYHSISDIAPLAPASIDVVINDSISASTSAYDVITSNSRAEIREFCIDKESLFPSLEEDGYSAQNNVIRKVQIKFNASSDSTFVDEIQVIAASSVVSSNCRIVIDNEEVFRSPQPVSSIFDSYEIQHQQGNIDVIFNGELVYGQQLDLDSATASIVAGGRTDGDRIDAAINKLTTIQYFDISPTSLSLPGRYIQTEATLRSNSSPLLRSFEYNFDSPIPEFPDRTFISNANAPEFFDTATVAIIGIGQREEQLVLNGSGEEDEGLPIDFNASNSPDGRHFRVQSFPIVPSTLRVFLTHNGTERLLSEQIDYTVNLDNGYVVLYHPIALGDRLRAEYTSAGDVNQPEMFFDIDSLTAKHGSISISNTLSLAASLAFANGAKRVLAVQALSPTLDQGWEQAYSALATADAYYVVPVPPSQYDLVVSNGLAHVESRSRTPNRQERVLIAGQTQDLPANGALRGSFRAVFLVPGVISTDVNGELATLDGRYLAAAYAGRASSLDQVAEPMLNKELQGFVLPDRQGKFTTTELDQFASGGTTAIRQLSSGGRAFKSITTTSSINVVEQEQSTVRIRDFLAINIRKTLEERFVGQVVVQEVLDSIGLATERFLESQRDQRRITRYSNIRVVADPEEPRQANVSFDVQPTFPLTDITIRVTVVAQL